MEAAHRGRSTIVWSFFLRISPCRRPRSGAGWLRRYSSLTGRLSSTLMILPVHKIACQYLLFDPALATACPFTPKGETVHTRLQKGTKICCYDNARLLTKLNCADCYHRKIFGA
ncbi:unnamed protein product [Urochloa humidicola]